MIKTGDESRTYILGAFTTADLAKKAADIEVEYSDGVYEPQIFTVSIDFINYRKVKQCLTA